MDAIAPYRLVIFDCDGTLVDSQHNIVAAMREAFARFGHPQPEAEAVRRQVGLTLEIAVARLLPDLDAAAVHEIAEVYRTIVRNLRGEGGILEPLYDGIRELIQRLEHPAVFLGVATGKNLVGLEHTLRHHRLRERFHTLQTADRAISKPHPDMVLKAMAECACEPAETVVIGDTSFDMEMARAARATAIGVNWGYHPAEELAAAGAARVIHHPADLIPCLQSLSASR
ncbi:MAG: HAD-IA family hydrolase [Rhodospirillaceae bacterium]|nr:HAD-IA family hydrolase [Rhodospirillaceae bacterium]